MKISKIIIFSAIAGVVILLSLAVISSIFVIGSPVRVSTSVSPSRAYIGQAIKYSIKVSYPSGMEIKLPEATGKIGELEIFGSEYLKSGFLARKKVTAIYSIKAFTPGNYYIPPLKVSYQSSPGEVWNDVLTEDQKLRIVPVVKFDPAKELLKKVSMVADSRVKEIAVTGQRGQSREIEIPVRFPIKDMEGPKRVYTPKDIFFISLWIAGGAVLLLIILIIVISVIIAAFQGKEPPVYKAYVNDLKDLRKEKLLEKGEKTDFCDRLYGVMTGYLKERFGLDKKEMTTDEFLSAVSSLEELEKEQKNFIKEKLVLCDLVKYSGYDPSTMELDKDLKDEINMIRELGKKEEPEEVTA